MVADVSLGLLVYLVSTSTTGLRAALILLLVSIWALRLAGYITWRNWGAGEDRRYQDIRRRNGNNFAFKSLFLVFGMQAILAWIISLPLVVAASGAAALGVFDYAGIALWLVGMVFETGADYQLARFRSRGGTREQVLDAGLWRHTRHPNYFGEFCVWWGFYLVAVAGGGWWTVISPFIDILPVAEGVRGEAS